MTHATGASNGRSWRSVTHEHPCPICSHADWCSVSSDGALACCRRQGEPGQERTDISGGTYWLHRLRSAAGPQAEPRYRMEDGQGRLADPDIRQRVYSALLGQLMLSDRHQQALQSRGARGSLLTTGYRSLPQRGRAGAVRHLIGAGLEEHLPTVPGFFLGEHDGRRYWTVGGRAGLLIPVRDVERRIIALLIRPDEQGQGGKYVWLSSRRRGGPGPGAPIHVPLHDGDHATVRITEGALKADLATQLSGLLTIGLPGVSACRRAARVLQELGATAARVALDADVWRNHAVAHALQQLVVHLAGAGLAVELETWHESEGKGIDDLLAAGRQPGVIQGEQVSVVVARIAEAARQADPPQNGSSPGGKGRRAATIILEHLRQRYQPEFRRGTAIYSPLLDRDVTRAEATAGADSDLVALLCLAEECPMAEGAPIRDAVPALYRRWAPTAWADLIASLPEEEARSDPSETAGHQLRRALDEALVRTVSLAIEHDDDGGTYCELRAIIDWAAHFAGRGREDGRPPDTWRSVRSYRIWSRLEPDEYGQITSERLRELAEPDRSELRTAQLRVAIRVELLSQLGCRELAALGQRRLGELCELYGVGRRSRAGHGGRRAIELDPEYVRGLLSDPQQAGQEIPQEDPAPCP